jgi:hypothetical protein
MPTPLYRLRLARDLQAKVAEVGRIYGAPNTSVFIRELLSAVCSGDQKELFAFQARLSEKLTGQLMLELVAAQKAKKPAVKGRTRPATQKGLKRR